MKQILDLNMEKALTGMGILSGYAGDGMIRLSAIQQLIIYGCFSCNPITI